MNPWLVIGWFLVGVISMALLGAVILIGTAGFAKFRQYLKWRSTRLTPIAVGQIWGNSFDRLSRVQVTDCITLNNGEYAWRFRYDWDKTANSWVLTEVDARSCIDRHKYALISPPA